MKKIFIRVGVIAMFAISLIVPICSINVTHATPLQNEIYDSYTTDDGWKVMRVKGYDQYGNFIHTLAIAIKCQSGKCYYKGRMAGLRYDNDEWYYVRAGNYGKFRYRVEQYESYFYFNL